MNNSEINVEQIMAQLKADIKARGLDDSELAVQPAAYGEMDDAAECSWETFDPERLAREMKEVQTGWSVGPECPIGVRGGIVGRLILVFKKIVRRIIRFYSVPVWEEQRSFNQKVTAVLNTLEMYVADSKANIDGISGGKALPADAERAIYYADKLIPRYIRRLDEEACAVRRENTELKERLDEAGVRLEAQAKEMDLLNEKLAVLELKLEKAVLSQR